MFRENITYVTESPFFPVYEDLLQTDKWEASNESEIKQKIWKSKPFCN